MPAKDQAAYMREYRKRQRRETVMSTTLPAQVVRSLIDAEDRLRALEAEVAHLKRELAARPPASFPPADGTNSTTPGQIVINDVRYEPVLVPGRGRQRVIDEALRKVNRKTKA